MLWGPQKLDCAEIASELGERPFAEGSASVIAQLQVPTINKNISAVTELHNQNSYKSGIWVFLFACFSAKPLAEEMEWFPYLHIFLRFTLWP